MIGRLWIFTGFDLFEGMWEGYEIQPAHRPYLNTRRDSQAVMQDISHPGMIHFVSLSLLTFPRSKSSSVINFFLLWDGGGADLFFKRMLFWVSGRQMPVQQEWEKVHLFSCTITNIILIIIKHLQARHRVKHHIRTSFMTVILKFNKLILIPKQ